MGGRQTLQLGLCFDPGAEDDRYEDDDGNTVCLSPSKTKDIEEDDLDSSGNKNDDKGFSLNAEEIYGRFGDGWSLKELRSIVSQYDSVSDVNRIKDQSLSQAVDSIVSKAVPSAIMAADAIAVAKILLKSREYSKCIEMLEFASKCEKKYISGCSYKDGVRTGKIKPIIEGEYREYQEKILASNKCSSNSIRCFKDCDEWPNKGRRLEIMNLLGKSLHHVLRDESKHADAAGIALSILSSLDIYMKDPEAIAKLASSREKKLRSLLPILLDDSKMTVKSQMVAVENFLRIVNDGIPELRGDAIDLWSNGIQRLIKNRYYNLAMKKMVRASSMYRSGCVMEGVLSEAHGIAERYLSRSAKSGYAYAMAGLLDMSRSQEPAKSFKQLWKNLKASIGEQEASEAVMKALKSSNDLGFFLGHQASLGLIENIEDIAENLPAGKAMDAYVWALERLASMHKSDACTDKNRIHEHISRVSALCVNRISFVKDDLSEKGVESVHNLSMLARKSYKGHMELELSALEAGVYPLQDMVYIIELADRYSSSDDAINRLAPVFVEAYGECQRLAGAEWVYNAIVNNEDKIEKGSAFAASVAECVIRCPASEDNHDGALSEDKVLSLQALMLHKMLPVDNRKSYPLDFVVLVNEFKEILKTGQGMVGQDSVSHKISEVITEAGTWIVAQAQKKSGAPKQVWRSLLDRATALVPN